MKCPQCAAEGERSKVYPGMTTTTCMAVSSWYDEDGNYHRHNPNTTTTHYSCSRGHEWTETQRGDGP